MTNTPDQAVYEGFALVEILGHRHTAGMLTTIDVGGAKLLRIDTPDPNGEDGKYVATQFYGPSAIYCITPCDKETVIQAVTEGRYRMPAPVRVLLRRAETPAISDQSGPDEPDYSGEDMDDDDDVVF